MSLVEVKPAGEGDGAATTERAGDEHAGMTDDRGCRKPRDFGVGQAHGILEPVRDSREPGPENETDGRTLGADPFYDGGGSLRGGRRPVRNVGCDGHARAPFIAAMSAVAAAMSFSRS